MKYFRLSVLLFVIFQTLMIFPEQGSKTNHASSPMNADFSEWHNQAITNIREMEYEASWQDSCAILGGKAGYHMANRKQNLRLYFFPEGFKAIRRTETNPSLILEGSLVSMGRNYLFPLSKPTLKTKGNRIDYIRRELVETYENTQEGIKQMISIQKSPKGSGSLKLLMAFSGDFTATKKNNTHYVFQQNKKNRMQLSGIQAKDAKGNNLPLATNPEESGILISVEDEKAAYPIQLEFLLDTPPPWTAEPDIQKINFGDSVATAGDVNGDGYSDLIIGAPKYDNGETDEGRVYVYLGSASGPESSSSWQYESNNEKAELGRSVSTAGDINGDGFSDVIIGAPKYSNGQTEEGGAFIFYGSASGLGNVPVILESDQASSNFGCSVSTAGDVDKDGYSDIIIGAYTYQDTLSEEGMAFVYSGKDDGIATSASWSKSGGQAGAHFGYSVCFAGDVNNDDYSDIIVGARYYNNGSDKQGMAYVYFGGASGLAASPAWSDPGDTKNDYQGWSVSTAGDVNGDGYADVIVGAPGYDKGETAEGAALVFYGKQTGLSASPNVTLEPNWANANFGTSVFTAGDMNGDGYGDVIVGAFFYSNEQDYEGIAYVYLGSKLGLLSLPDWVVESGQVGANYGQSVATAGDVNGDGYSDIIVGAPNYDSPEDNEGKCFLYYGEPKSLSKGYAWEVVGSQADTELGTTMAGAGDVNGDGYADIIIGAPYFDNGETNEGRVFIYHGRSNDAPETTAARTLESNEENYQFGYSVASTGDVNGDGYDDIIMGAPGYNNNAGLARICYGSASGIGAGFDWSYGLATENCRFGESVAGAGDVNGDGYLDIIIGIPNYPNGECKGAVYVLLGDSSGVPYSNQFVYKGDQAGGYLGNSVASAGDVNGDGYSDVIVGAYGYSNGETSEGRAYLFYGSYNGITTYNHWTAEIDQTSATFGTTVAGAGDVNGDGYSDVIIGAPNYNNGASNVGGAFVYYGSADGISGTTWSWKGEGTQEFSLYGHCVAGAGDVNGDGFSDVIIGAYSFDLEVENPFPFTFTDAGAAYIYLGSDSGLDTSYDWYAAPRNSNQHFGRCVAGAGDVNGDGYCDVIIGAPGHKVTTDKVGRAVIYLGGGGNGRDVELRQSNYNKTDRVSRLSRTEIPRYSLETRVLTSFGRTKAKMEWETKLFGTPLDGTSTDIGLSWIFITSAPWSQSFQPSFENSLFHWRCRTLYHPTTSPYQPHGRWLQIPWNGAQEADLRMGPDDKPTVQDIVNYLLARHHYARDVNSDTIIDAADVVDFLVNP